MSAIHDKKVTEAEEKLRAAEAALAAWDADTAKVAALKEAERLDKVAESASETAHKAYRSAKAEVFRRLGLGRIDDGAYVWSPTFVRAVEQAVGWKRADAHALTPGNAPRSHPWDEAAEALAERILSKDKKLQFAKKVRDNALTKRREASDALYYARRGRQALTDRIHRATRDRDDALAEQQAANEREAERHETRTTPDRAAAAVAEERAARERKAAIKAARKVCAELIKGTRAFEWPIKEGAK